MLPPIVVFVFNRLQTTQRVLVALQNQTLHPPLLIVFADAARNAEETKQVDAVRTLIRQIDWTNVELIEREQNFGSTQNIIQGITSVFEKFARAVVVEDDVLPARHFYEAMCLLLERYADEHQVFSVSGYPSLKHDALPNYPYDVILSPRFCSWGWATWTDRWRQAVQDTRGFQNPFSSFKEVPTIAGEDLPRMAKELEDQPGITWDVPLALLCLHHQWLNAITFFYLTNNIGLDSGTNFNKFRHNWRVAEFHRIHNPIQENLPATFPPILLREDVSLAIQDYRRSSYQSFREYPTVLDKLVRKVKRTLQPSVRNR